jgi:hypothetical protein
MDCLATSSSCRIDLRDEAARARRRRADAEMSSDLSVVACPMAQKYWVQHGHAVRNPYYGRAMVDCGRVVKE